MLSQEDYNNLLENENVKDIFFDTTNRSEMPVQIYIGMRGCGKTYSTLREHVYDMDKQTPKLPRDTFSGKFMYLRHTDKQIRTCATEGGNPFKKLNRNIGLDITPKRTEGYSEFYNQNVLDKKRKIDPNSPPVVLGYGVALSTFGNLRGVDFSDVDYITFDEFIDQSKRIKALTKECGEEFQHLRETVGRNREMFGEKPLQIKLLANSISLDSPILLELGAAQTLSHMVLKHQNKATIKEKGIYIEIIEAEKFKDLKKQTSLYMGADTDSRFVQQALENKFVNDNMSFVRKVPLNEYIPIFTYAHNYTWYRHKSRHEAYVSAKSVQVAPRVMYKTSDIDKLIAEWELPYRRLILQRKIYFDNYATKLVLDSIFE